MERIQQAMKDEHGFSSSSVHYIIHFNLCILFQLTLFHHNQSAPRIEEIIAQLETAHKASKRNFDSIRNECRALSQQGMDKDSVGALKKMGEDVMKAHKQCGAEISATKKLREEISEEITQGISKFGENLLKIGCTIPFCSNVNSPTIFTVNEHGQAIKAVEQSAENLLRYLALHHHLLIRNSIPVILLTALGRYVKKKTMTSSKSRD